MQFIDDSKKYSLEDLFNKASDIKLEENNKNFTNKNDELFFWSDDKYNEVIKNNGDISAITKEKYNCDIFKLCLDENEKINITSEEIIFKLLQSNNREDQEKILLKKYKHLIVIFNTQQQTKREIIFYLLYYKNNDDNNNSLSSNEI